MLLQWKCRSANHQLAKTRVESWHKYAMIASSLKKSRSGASRMKIAMFIYGCFPKNRDTPKWMVYNGKTLLKWMIWGSHYFRKHPYSQVWMAWFLLLFLGSISKHQVPNPHNPSVIHRAFLWWQLPQRLHKCRELWRKPCRKAPFLEENEGKLIGSSKNDLIIDFSA